MKIKATDSFQNPNRWCDFHNNHGHKTKYYITLKMEVNELLKKGHLPEFLSDKAKYLLIKRQLISPLELLLLRHLDKIW